MNRIRLDFTAPGPHPGLLSWLLLALGLAAFGLTVFAWREADDAARAAQAGLAALSRAPAAKPAKTMKKGDTAALARERGEAEARRALALPWTRLLTVLQESRPDDIAFLELEADGRRGDFQITAAAKSHQAMLDYYRSLKAEPGFRAVSLMRHELRDIDGLQGVDFSLRGEWTRP